jgi:1-phosphatidylinositol-3-phosphate 5-kinase
MSSLTGSYTFAKTLEYKAKQGLNPEKQVTVVPPHEYQQRFVNAMNDYFPPCPGMLSFPSTALHVNDSA